VRGLALAAVVVAGACGHGTRPDPTPPTNDGLVARAAAVPRGAYPRWAHREQTYWTVFGVDGGAADALIDTDGRVEVAAGAWSLEPFVELDGRWVNWADVTTSQTLAEGALPVPSVAWKHPDFTLELTAFAAGAAADPTGYVRYRLVPAPGARRPARLWIAVRPLQVLPPWQDLNVVGGVGRLPPLALDGRTLRVGTRTLVAVPAPAAWRALPFEQPPLDSRALAFPLPRDAPELVVDVAVPLTDGGATPALPSDTGAAHAAVGRTLADTTAAWRQRLARPRLDLPPAAGDLAQVAAATVGYVLVNRDGPALQPGTRNYERSWIRDGALTASTLLAFGQDAPVREYLLWYAGFQFPDGKVPCCVDRRGADPTPEYDSDGEFIYATAEYWRFTRDRATLDRLWPHVRAAATHIDALRTTEREERLRGTAVYGLVPESISHEGYHRRAVHSYWDDFFALRGLADAAALAAVVGDRTSEVQFGRAAAEFKQNLRASLARVIAERRIDYVPGSVELADFDPTSTAIAVTVAGAADVPPRAALRHTFERYHDEIVRWRAGAPARDAFTPYEARNAAALVRLGRREEALDVLAFVLAGRRPPGWQEWAEVVWTDPLVPRFIGDMPHTWAAEAVVQTLRTMLVYERAGDGALVLAAGVPAAWLDDPAGVAVDGLPTHAGPLTYRLDRPDARTVRIAVAAGPDVPRAGILLAPPLRGWGRVLVDGRPVRPGPDGAVLVRHLPVVVSWEAP
jgi:hypothetical protein